MLYILYIGGDYIERPFFQHGVFCKRSRTLRLDLFANIEAARVGLVGVVVLGCLGVHPSFTTRKDYGAAPGFGITSEWSDKGIADERASWYQHSGLLHASRHTDMPRSVGWWDYRATLNGFITSVGSSRCVGHIVPAGYLSYFTPRECHMYHLNGQVRSADGKGAEQV